MKQSESMESCGRPVDRKVGVSGFKHLFVRVLNMPLDYHGISCFHVILYQKCWNSEAGRLFNFLRQYELFSSILWIFWNSLIANKLMTSGYNIWYQHFFYLQTTLNRLFNNFITLSWYCRLVLLERPPSKKTKKNYLHKIQPF